jgi:hypothetical protein
MVTVSKKRTTPKNAAKKTVTKKTAVSAKKTATRKTTKKSTSPSKPGTSSIDITPEERWKMIAVAAYHQAEKGVLLQLTSCRTGPRQKRKLISWCSADRILTVG